MLLSKHQATQQDSYSSPRRIVYNPESEQLQSSSKRSKLSRGNIFTFVGLINNGNRTDSLANNDTLLVIALNKSNPTQIPCGEKERIKQTITAFYNFPNNWDDENGVSPSKLTVDNALLFIDMLPLGITIPEPGLSNDGELNLFAKKDKLYIDIGFRGDGTYSYFIRDNQGKEYIGNNLPLKSGLPNNLIEVLLSYKA